MADRIYLVMSSEADDDKAQLVTAGSRAQALNHAIRDKYTVTVATTMQVAEIVGAGGKVEKAAASE